MLIRTIQKLTTVYTLHELTYAYYKFSNSLMSYFPIKQDERKLDTMNTYKLGGQIHVYILRQ